MSVAGDVDFKFWALTIPKDSERTLKMENNNSVYHVSNATLGNKVEDGRTTVFLKANGKKSPICNLINNTLENASLDFIVSRSMNASFEVKGVNPVTVSGYVQPLDEVSEGEQMNAVMDLTQYNDAEEILNGKTSEAKEEESDVEMPEAKSVAAAEPVAEAKDSKKRKLEEMEKTEEAKPPHKKKSKKKKKKKIQKINGEAEKAVEAQKAKVDEQTKDEAEAAKEAAPEDEPKKAAEKDAAKPKGKSKTGKKSKKMVDAGKGVKYRVLKKGKAGVNPAKDGDRITLLYVGCLKDGKQFDKNLKEGLTFKLGGDEVIPGIELGVLGMCPNEKRRIIIPSEQGYGEDGASEGAIPPNAELTFTVMRKA